MITEYDKKIAYNIRLFNLRRHGGHDDLLREYCKLFCKRDFKFGKYKGENIGYIIIMDRQYIDWLLKNTKFKMNDQEQALFEPVSIILWRTTGEYYTTGKEVIEEYYPDYDLLDSLYKQDQ